MNELTQESFLAEALLADRMQDVPRSFIREILKVAIDSDIISFAGGLPNPDLFPVEALQNSAIRVFEKHAARALQYSNTEGYLPLREYISGYYKERHQLEVSPDNILITNGSQQALDLIGKVILNAGDEVIIESPGYLGAIQAFSIFQPRFIAIPLNNDGIDNDLLESSLTRSNPKLFYTVPQFQNPSGISYSVAVREKAASVLKEKNMLVVEDNPYIDLRFSGEGSKSFYHYLDNQCILLGTFSKIAVPGMRLGWLVASGEIMEKLVIAKQAADLHTSIFNQILLYEYMTNNPLENHLAKIRKKYSIQAKAMVSAIREFFPSGIEYTQPEGGMFMWCKMPNGKSSKELFEAAIKKKVAFVPGNPFYTDKKSSYPTFRLNFSCSEPEVIFKGIKNIAEAYASIG